MDEIERNVCRWKTEQLKEHLQAKNSIVNQLTNTEYKVYKAVRTEYKKRIHKK